MFVRVLRNGMIRDELGRLDRVRLYNAAENVPRTPTIAFTVEGISPGEVCRWMAEEHSIFVADGNFYAGTLGDVLGVNATGGWVRAGLAPYKNRAGKPTGLPVG